MSSDGTRVDVAYIETTTVVTVEGEVDMASALVLRRVLEAAPTDCDVVVHLGGIDFIDSSGLAVLAAQWRRFNLAGDHCESTARLHKCSAC